MKDKAKDLERLKNCSALVVDDDPKQVDFLKNTLSHFFGEIITANDGEEALELYKTHQPHVVFTDYVMPKMDGLKLCNALRDIKENLPIIILSNYSEKDKLLSIIPLKVTTYLLKPASLTVLIDTLQIVLRELINTQQIDFVINDDLTYNFFSKTLYSKQDGIISLAKNEIMLLELFIDHRNSLVSNDMIELELANEKELSYKAIANILYRLRKKIGKENLLNVQSIGYMLKSS